MIELFVNGKKKLHYEGQSMWDVGLTVMQFGIYQSKEAKTFKGKTGTLQEMKDTPTIMFYDEIWAKKKCKDLQLDRLGYSCENLESQSDNSTKPYRVYRASQQEYIVIVKNKIDKIEKSESKLIKVLLLINLKFSSLYAINDPKKNSQHLVIGE